MSPAAITLEEFGARLEALSAGALAEAIRPALVRGALVIQRRAKENLIASHQMRTGRLRASITARVDQFGGQTAIIASAGGDGTKGAVKYAAMQEYGGTQVPRTAKMLRIPLSGGPALTAAGVDRFPTPLRQSAPDGFFRIQPSMGRLFLVHDVGRRLKKGGGESWGRGGRTEFWYLLVHSSTIPARPYLRPAVQQTAADTVGPALAKATISAIRNGPKQAAGDVAPPEGVET